MNPKESVNKTQDRVKKAGRKVKFAISAMSPEERLNSLADIVIERIIEESRNSKLALQPGNKENSQI